MDTVSAIASVRLAMESIDQGDADAVDRHRQLARTQVDASSRALEGIEDSDVRAGGVWRSVFSAAARVAEGIRTLDASDDMVTVRTILDAADADLVRATWVLPQECLVP